MGLRLNKCYLVLIPKISGPTLLMNLTQNYLQYISGHLSAVQKWGGKTSDYAKSEGAKPKIHGKH